MSDKDVLLSMGFDPARVECTRTIYPSSRFYCILIYHPTGAIKATGGRGLQPTMDFLLANEDKPVPDLSSVSAASSAPSAGGSGDAPMDVDEDQEELAALQAVYGKAHVAPAESAEGGGPAEAKVRVDSARHAMRRQSIDIASCLSRARVSSARSAARSSRTLRSRTTTRRRVATTSSKSPRRRCAVRP